ncbi:MAG TPA: winged helix-turn-helix domain-containing protein [Steroidobacteraceae bacterium]
MQELPLQILDELLARPGELVTREQLIARLWPRRIVDFEGALNAAVRRLRVALGDEAETPRYIETIPRHGYRFIGTVLPPVTSDPARLNETAPATGHARRPGWAWLAVAVLACAAITGVVVWNALHKTVSTISEGAHQAQAAIKSIAVLPFVDMSAAQDQQYFADGLTEELITHLAQTLPIRVTARTSSFSFKGRPIDIATVARKLQVTHVLEGSVRKSEDRVRITAQLIDATTSSHLWSQSYDRKVDDFLKVQDEISTAVANALHLALTASVGYPSANARLYEYLFQGRFYFDRREPGDIERAAANYRRAVELDPSFARGWAGLASVYWIQTVTGMLAPPTGLERVREAAERALKLDPNLAEAHIRMANYLSASGNIRASVDQMRLAAALEPNNPLVIAFASGDAAEEGRLDDAIELLRSGLASDPLSMMYRTQLAWVLYLAGRIEEAKAEFLQAEKIVPTQARQGLGQLLIGTGEFNGAIELLRNEPDSAARAQCLALAYHGLGQKARAEDALAALIESYGDSDPILIAEVYAFRGQADQAFKWLQKHDEKYKDHVNVGNPKIPWILNRSPFFKSLHSDARWDAWLASGTQAAPAPVAR